mgnify:CR=1 FL=1
MNANINIDIVIHSGDESNYKDQYQNEPEFRDFILWFANLKIKHKVFIAGNHSSFVFHNKNTLICAFKLHHNSNEKQKYFCHLFYSNFRHLAFIKNKSRLNQNQFDSHFYIQQN